MLMSYLTPEERKEYKRGDYRMYDKSNSRYHKCDDQKRLKLQYEKEQAEPYISHYMPVRKVSCAFCGDVFYTDNVRRKYCSGRCVNDAYMERRDKRKQDEREKVCPICGNFFTAKTKATIYCSQACKQKSYRRRHEIIQRPASEWK